MEQASNTFSRGLQTDTHPMIQGNDSLSDALNATFVTMNGNEVILQNDMGNRRVDHAYLPAGYQPVGMKEYGGIIYVAAYNPITNRSQIGSFPSPERKMGTEYTNLGGNWDPNIFTKDKNTSPDSNLNFLIADTSLLKLTDDNSLHAGDKFAVYSSTICSRGDITNLNNTNGTKAISPKNKQYTLALGILNSQNEFVDITKTLHRWNSNSIIDEDGKSEIYKFNDGYFIANTDRVPDNWKRQTNDDAELLKNRLAKPINTYAYKLVGPLYLKTTLNHIENVSYNIYGIYKDSKATLWVEANITYNCPDGISIYDEQGKIIISGSDDNYITYAEGKPSFTGFDFYKLDSSSTLLSPTETKKSNCQYNPSTNLYTVTILKKYTDVTASSGDILNYYFCVPAINNIYLKGLSEKGSINLSLLGSGEIELNGWRFYNNDTQTTLTYSFNAYPKYHEKFSNLSFKFTNVNNSSNVITLTEEDGLVLNNGRNTIIFNWKNQRFTERSLYKVTISYDIIDTDTGNITPSGDITTNEWFLTTQLFNNCYNPSNINDYMNDFGSTKPQAQTIRDKYLTVELETFAHFKDQSEEKTITNKGKLLSKSEDLVNIDKVDYIYIEYKHEQPVSIKGEFTLKIKNENLYPKYISLNTQGQAMNIDSSSIEINTEELINQIGYYAEHDIKYPKSGEDYKKMIETNNFSVSNNIINGTITYYDKFLGVAKSAEDLQITNGFTSIKDAVEKLVEQTQNETKQYTGIYMNFHERGGDDYHVLNSAVNHSKEFDNRISYDWENPPGGIQIDRDDDDDRIDFDVKTNYNKITQEFNNANPSNPFIWLGLDGTNTNWECWATTKDYGGAGQEDPKEKKFARIWWRTANLNYPWALLERYATSSADVSKAILDHFENKGENIYICFYKQTTLNGFYIPNKGNYNYNNEYNLNPNISFKVKQSPGSSISGNPPEAPIKFKLPNSLLEQYVTYDKLSINSLELFQDIVSNSDNIIKDGIDINTGLNLDSDNKPLSINSVYIKNSDGTLKENMSSKITPNSSYYGGKYYGFVYGNSNTYTPGSPNNTDIHCYMYDFIGDGHDGDSDTVLSYKSINMVKKGSING